MVGLGSLCLWSASLNLCPARINRSRTYTCDPARHSISNLFHRYNCEDSQEGGLQSKARHSQWRTMLFCDVKWKDKSSENTLKLRPLSGHFSLAGVTPGPPLAQGHTFKCCCQTFVLHVHWRNMSCMPLSLYLSSVPFLLSFRPLCLCFFISMSCITEPGWSRAWPAGAAAEYVTTEQWASPRDTKEPHDCAFRITETQQRIYSHVHW